MSEPVRLSRRDFFKIFARAASDCVLSAVRTVSWEGVGREVVIDRKFMAFPVQHNTLATSDKHVEAQELEKRHSKKLRRVWRIIENEVRRKFGHKKVGEAWTSETILYYMVKRLFRGKRLLGIIVLSF